MRRVTRKDLFGIGLMLGLVAAALFQGGCSTLNGLGNDLSGLAQGMTANFNQPTRIITAPDQKEPQK